MSFKKKEAVQDLRRKSENIGRDSVKLVRSKNGKSPGFVRIQVSYLQMFQGRMSRERGVCHNVKRECESSADYQDLHKCKRHT